MTIQTTTYYLRGFVQETGGAVSHPLHGFTSEPSVEEAKAQCADLVALMRPDTTWTITTEEKGPAKQEVEA